MSIPDNLPVLDRSTPTIDAPTLFAGMARVQFGHVILNCLGHLWCLDKLPAGTSLLYWDATKRGNHPFNFISPLLDLLGIENEFEVRKTPAVYSQLYTCSNAYGEAPGGLGNPVFHRWLDHRLPPASPIDANRKVYLTRSKLGPSVGRYACEDHLEKLLEREGYETVAPETLSLTDQIKLFQTARKLIFAEGSALHLFAMVKRTDQQAVVIQRREHLPRMMALQMNDRGGLPVAPVCALKSVYWPQKRSDHLSVSVLDFKKLKSELVRHDMISHNADWPDPSAEAEQFSLSAGLSDGERMLDRAGRRKWLKDFRQNRRN